MIIGLIADTILKFINYSRYKIFGYRFFKSERNKTGLTYLKVFFSLQQFKTQLNACCNLVLVCKDIIPKYGRTRSKHFFSNVGTFSLARKIWILHRNFLETLANKIFRVTIFKYCFQRSEVTIMRPQEIIACTKRSGGLELTLYR